MLFSLLLLFVVAVFFVGRSLSPLERAAHALPRIVSIATTNANDMLGLAIIAAGAGIFVLSDRRRRARGRQASS